ncbi:MAG: Acetyl esterase [Mucilaginibacter sp.]|nr:Acetyl esterase [Mucilaginibacter sp.]
MNTRPDISSQALDPVIAELLKTKFNDEYKVSSFVPAFRSRFNEFIGLVSFSDTDPMLIRELKFVIGELPEFKIRIYDTAPDIIKPVLVYFHGGNWIAGNLQTCDNVCRTLAAGSRYAVISVDYALAPENGFPVPLYQGLEVIDWVRKQGQYFGIDQQKIVVGGDNAGGNIAAGLVHLLNKLRGIKLSGQLLICPALQYRFDTPSYLEYNKGYLLSREAIQEGWGEYLQKIGDVCSEFAAPLLVESTAHVPPTLIYTAEYDPLRDEAELYADLLQRQGIPVSFQRYRGVTHYFWLMDGILNIARQAHKDAIDFLTMLNKPVV